MAPRQRVAARHIAREGGAAQQQPLAAAALSPSPLAQRHVCPCRRRRRRRRRRSIDILSPNARPPLHTRPIDRAAQDHLLRRRPPRRAAADHRAARGRPRGGLDSSRLVVLVVVGSAVGLVVGIVVVWWCGLLCVCLFVWCWFDAFTRPTGGRRAAASRPWGWFARPTGGVTTPLAPARARRVPRRRRGRRPRSAGVPRRRDDDPGRGN